jgi:hypothetical protein
MSKIDDCLRELPKTLKIGAYDWTVLIEDGESELCAQGIFQVQHLKIWPMMLTSPNHAVGVVLHECLHVIFDNENLSKMKRNKEEREETIITGFEVGLISLLRDNPKFLVWMKKWLR